jgi:hypothetical protein
MPQAHCVIGDELIEPLILLTDRRADDGLLASNEKEIDELRAEGRQGFSPDKHISATRFARTPKTPRAAVRRHIASEISQCAPDSHPDKMSIKRVWQLRKS